MILEMLTKQLFGYWLTFFPTYLASGLDDVSEKKSWSKLLQIMKANIFLYGVTSLINRSQTKNMYTNVQKFVIMWNINTI